MKSKLYSNMKRMTTGFCISILCVTLSMLALRLTVFSDMAPAPEKAASALLSSEKDGYQINGSVYFSSATAKGDFLIANLSTENLIMIDITLKNTGESIFSSGLLNPGTAMNTARMNPFGQKLADGRYDCVVEITARDPSNVKTIIGTANEVIEVHIGEKPDKAKDD